MPSTPKGPRSLLRELLDAVGKISRGTVGRPTSPGPVVDIHHHDRRTDPPRR
ncbi:hypothetical protein [Sphaerisporangium sp. TRM90804]|uniref:hypothetical protein n=1 Tax=Sphaerisporangium sp. TRM90804 TaxID=3031113 RepID=UPI0024484A00|nr:hypothetical protein [Sphaerisporangium sp. TRM90804]MDH2424617.1 hypothetical protein [Sphaerisporangium sp. TRM90804]